MTNTYTLESWLYLLLYLFGIAAHYAGKILFYVGQAEFRFALVGLYILTEIWGTLKGLCREEEFENV